MDKTDVKAQTPLFVAMVNQHWECAEALLEAGADPNGNEKNLCTPLAVMAQRGYYEGMCNSVSWVIEFLFWGLNLDKFLAKLNILSGFKLSMCYDEFML